MVPQETFLFSETLRENLGFGAPNAAAATNVWTGQYEQPTVNNAAQRLRQAPFVGTADAQGNFVPGSAHPSLMAMRGRTYGTTLGGLGPMPGAKPPADSVKQQSDSLTRLRRRPPASPDSIPAPVPPPIDTLLTPMPPSTSRWR